MTLDVDSTSWTGISSLTEAERSGELVYAENTSRLRRHRIVAAVIAVVLLGLAVWQATLIDIVTANPFEKGPLFFILLMLLFEGAAAIVWRWLGQRLDSSHQTAPLCLRGGDLIIGSSARRIAFRDVVAIKPGLPQSLFGRIAWLFYQSPLRAWSRPVQLFQLELKAGSTPILLDLDVIDGPPGKIREIVEYRLRRANP